MSLRTLRQYRADGMHVEDVDGRLFVRLEHVLAWKRWRGLNDAARKSRRECRARDGSADAHVTDSQLERAFQEWVRAGGKP
ncbi:hypothetical protein ACXR2T_10710 [Leucobacter sp. HY1910]